MRQNTRARGAVTSLLLIFFRVRWISVEFSLYHNMFNVNLVLNYISLQYFRKTVYKNYVGAEDDLIKKARLIKLDQRKVQILNHH